MDSYEYRKLGFLIHKSIFVYAANSQFWPNIYPIYLSPREDGRSERFSRFSINRPGVRERDQAEPLGESALPTCQVE